MPPSTCSFAASATPTPPWRCWRNCSKPRTRRSAPMSAVWKTARAREPEGNLSRYNSLRREFVTIRRFPEIVAACAALWLLSAMPAAAQEPTLEQSIPHDVMLDKRRNILSVVVENDSLGGGGTDRNYSSGVRINYIDILSDLPPLAHAIAKLVPTFKIKRTTAVYYSAGQNLYT